MTYQNTETGEVLTEEEFAAKVQALVDEEIAKRVQRGDLVKIHTLPDGTHLYRGWTPVNQWPQ